MTMKDVAKAAHVSTSTVSRVLNGGHMISEATILRVNEAMDRLNYRPNRIARSLRVTSTRTIAVLVSNVANPFFAELVRAIEDKASEQGIGLVLGNASEMPERQESYLRAFIEQQVDGLIITPTGQDSGWVEDFKRRGIPLVFVDRTIPGVDVPSVTTDHDAALDSLVKHLVALGHTSAALVTGVPTNVPTRRRVEGFLSAARRYGIAVRDDDVLVGGPDRAQGKAVVHNLLARPYPEVLFSTNNMMALGALEAIGEAGLTVPDDLAFASYDDNRWFAVLNPPVTAIAQPVTELGHAAFDLITRMIAGETVESFALPATFVARRSCGELT